MLHVYLGRFAPFHEGHRILLTKLIKKFGVENCLVLIGSTNVIDERTPFTFEARKDMIQKSFPEVKIMPLPNVGDDDIWLDSIGALEEKLGHKFSFYGGSQEDLKILSERFSTQVLVDRYTEGKGISATQIRRKMQKSGTKID